MPAPSRNPRDPAFGLIPGVREFMPVDQSLAIFAQTAFNRAFEFEVAQAYDQKHIKAPIYLSVGQEHIPAAIAAVRRNWLIFAQHRGHAYYLSFGGDAAALVDELLHRDTGCARGMGGSASIHDPHIGMFGHGGLMGDQAAIAVGAALVARTPTLAVVGDASVEEDYVFAAMGFAATKKAPVLFICEDNDLSILTHVSARRSWNMTDVARSLGMEAADIADDPWLISHYVEEFLPRLPCYLNVRTCRNLWHAGTGTDGEPEWNRYELFRETLAERASRDRIGQLEQEGRERASRLWGERLPRPSRRSLATT